MGKPLGCHCCRISCPLKWLEFRTVESITCISFFVSPIFTFNKVMKLPGGNVDDSLSVAGVLVEGEVLCPLSNPQPHQPLRIALIDFSTSSNISVSTNVTSASSRPLQYITVFFLLYHKLMLQKWWRPLAISHIQVKRVGSNVALFHTGIETILLPNSTNEDH